MLYEKPKGIMLHIVLVTNFFFFLCASSVSVLSRREREKKKEKLVKTLLRVAVGRYNRRNCSF